MAPGRTVPWCCWEEWYLVRDWLLSQSHNDIRHGIKRVEAWRARGRLPLGVDITASLLETALCDASFWGPAAATVLPSKASVAASFISQQQIRLQYSATIVRMVNGIADSQQKGRVALSVNSLAEAAGLSRLLVDVRHEATHNELPSLSTLQLAAQQALDWLVSQYWQRQADHLQACHMRVQGILAAIFESCKAAAAKNAAAAAAAAEEDEEPLAGQDDGLERSASGGGGGYKASEGRKQRKLLLAELKGLVPPSHTALLAALMLRSGVLQPPRQQGPQEQQQQQQRPQGQPPRQQGPQDQQQGSGQGSAAHITALTALSKQYPDLRVLLLEEVVSTLAELPAQQQQQQECVQDQQQQQGTCVADNLVAWLQLLLPAERESTADAAPSTTGKSGSGGRSKFQQQQQQQQGSSCAEQLGGSVYSAACLSRMLAKVIKARQAVGSASDQAAAGGTLADQGEGSAAAAAASAVQHLQQARQLLSATLARTTKQVAAAGSSSSSKKGSTLLQQLAELAAPRGMSSNSSGGFGSGLDVVQPTAAASGRISGSKGAQVCAEREQQQQQHVDWQQQQQQQHELLQQAADKQQQLITQQQQQRKRKRPEQDTAAAAGDGAHRKRWQKVASWSACAIGCLPHVLRPQDLLALLHSSVSGDDTCGQTAAAAAEQQAVQEAGGNADVADVLQPPQTQLVLLEIEQAALRDAAGAAEVSKACAGSQYEQQVEAAADDGEGVEGGGMLRFGQHWQISRQELGQLQQTVRVLL